MPLKLDPWQEEFLAYEGSAVLCTGRQVGKTEICAIKASETAVSKPNQQILIVSATLEQAELMIMKILAYLESEHKDMLGRGKIKPTKHQIQLKNKSWIRCRPVGNMGDSLRGFTGTMLICDEAARLPEPAFDSARPTLMTTNGTIILLSTPFGRQGYFYECFQNKHDRFKVWHVSSEEVINNREISPTWTEAQREGALKFLEDEKKSMPAVRYQQEYGAEFVDELRQFFPDKLIMERQTVERVGIEQGKVYSLGVDVARMGMDQSSFEIFKQEGKRLVQVENLTTSKTYLSDTTRFILQLNRSWNFEKIYIDSEGMGIGVFDYLMQEESTRRKTIEILNSKRMINWKDKKEEKIQKEYLYNNLLRMMEWGEIDLLKDDSVFQSLKSVQAEYVQDAHGKYTLKIFGNNTHICEGITRAIQIGKSKDLNLWIKSIKV